MLIHPTIKNSKQTQTQYPLHALSPTTQFPYQHFPEPSHGFRNDRRHKQYLSAKTSPTPSHLPIPAHPACSRAAKKLICTQIKANFRPDGHCTLDCAAPAPFSALALPALRRTAPRVIKCLCASCTRVCLCE